MSPIVGARHVRAAVGFKASPRQANDNETTNVAWVGPGQRSERLALFWLRFGASLGLVQLFSARRALAAGCSWAVTHPTGRVQSTPGLV